MSQKPQPRAECECRQRSTIELSYPGVLKNLSEYKSEVEAAEAQNVVEQVVAQATTPWVEHQATGSASSVGNISLNIRHKNQLLTLRFIVQ